MAQTIKGIQDAGTIACAKHFIMNEQEHYRQVGEEVGRNHTAITEALSSNVDDVTMHELYLVVIDFYVTPPDKLTMISGPLPMLLELVLEALCVLTIK